MSILQLFFGFTGRIPRRTFFFCFLILLALNVALTYLLLPMFDFSVQTYLDDTRLKSWKLDTIVFAILFWPDIAISYKRLHDLGLSGKIYGIFSLLCLSFFFATSQEIFTNNPLDNNVFLIGLFTLVLIIVAFLAVMIFKKGQPHENRWGQAPV